MLCCNQSPQPGQQLWFIFNDVIVRVAIVGCWDRSAGDPVIDPIAIHSQLAGQSTYRPEALHLLLFTEPLEDRRLPSPSSHGHDHRWGNVPTARRAEPFVAQLSRNLRIGIALSA